MPFLVSVVELTPFLSISVCWFGFGCRRIGSGARRDGVAGLKRC